MSESREFTIRYGSTTVTVQGDDNLTIGQLRNRAMSMLNLNGGTMSAGGRVPSDSSPADPGEEYRISAPAEGKNG